jgi:hypothetical protein
LYLSVCKNNGTALNVILCHLVTFEEHVETSSGSDYEATRTCNRCRRNDASALEPQSENRDQQHISNLQGA